MHRATDDLTATDRGDPERLAYSVSEAARLVGISPRRMWDKVRERKVRSFREGQRRLISRKALEEYVAARESQEVA